MVIDSLIGFAGELAPCQVLSSVSFRPFASMAVELYNVSHDITLNEIGKGGWRRENWSVEVDKCGG